MRRPAIGLAALAVAVAAAAGPARADDGFTTAGDVLRVALPVAAGVCAWQQDRFASYATGFAVAAGTTAALQYGLGDAAINEKPNGGTHGFPSGHAVTAFSGAGDLALHCAPGNPWVAVTAGAAAVAVAASRLDADEHDLVQVLAGAAIGFFSTGITVTRTPGGSGYGLSYEMHF